MDPVWEELHSSQRWGVYPSDELVATVMRRVRPHDWAEPPKVLEIGCGGGANLSFFVREGFATTGIDGSPSAVAKAQRYLEQVTTAPATFEVREGRFPELDWPDATFDLVVDFLALYANPVATIEATVAECRRVLKPGGAMYSRVWGRGTTGDTTGDIFEPGTSRNPTVGPCRDMGISHFFTREELEALYGEFASCALKRIETHGPSEGDCAIEWVVWAEKSR